MFFAHLPAGYLIGRVMMNSPACPPKTRNRWILAAAMTGAVLPDIDLLYLYFLDASPQHHHTYWTHLPVAWLGIGALAAIASRHRSRNFRMALLAFMLGWLSHLVLDTFVGHIWWLYPLRDQPCSIAEVENRYQPWWMNLILHWTMLLELIIIAAAAWVEIRSPLIFTRFRLARTVALMGLFLAVLMLKEAYLPAPAPAQPVLGARAKDWNPHSFWHPNWGSSGVHKGIDIFAERGTPVMASEHGLVLYRGNLKQGGKIVLVLSPRGWLHYYAHLQSAMPGPGAWVVQGEPIGFVGDTGNAKGKPPHLHYSIFSPIPGFQSFRPGKQGWVRVFYHDPDRLLRQQHAAQVSNEKAS